MTIHYRDTEPGVYQGLRVWQDDQGMFVIDCEKGDSTLSNIEWEYATLAEALHELPLIYAVQVLGARIVTTPGEPNPAAAQTPAMWHLYTPIEGGGEEANVYRRKEAAEAALRRWVGV